MQFATETINGKSYNWRKLTMRDMQALAAKLAAIKRKSVQENLKSLRGIGIGEDKLPMCVQELSREPSQPEVTRWLYTVDGIVEVSAVATGVPVTEIADWPNDMRYTELALEAAGLIVRGGVEAPSEIPLSVGFTEATVTST